MSSVLIKLVTLTNFFIFNSIISVDTAIVINNSVSTDIWYDTNSNWTGNGANLLYFDNNEQKPQFQQLS